MIIFAVDCETIPNQLIPKSCIPEFDSSEIKYGNTKDPAKKALKEEEERKKFEEGLNKKMSLDPALCQVCTFVGIKYDTESDEIISEMTLQLKEDDKHNDYNIISDAWEAIQSSYYQKIPLVTFNGWSFDLPVLAMRAIIQDVHVTKSMFKNLMGRYENHYHYDLMQILSNWDRQRWHSQDFYFRLFGLGDKSDFDGSMVYEAYQNREYDKILAYCRKEVALLCEMFARVEPWIKITREGDLK